MSPPIAWLHLLLCAWLASVCFCNEVRAESRMLVTTGHLTVDVVAASESRYQHPLTLSEDSIRNAWRMDGNLTDSELGLICRPLQKELARLRANEFVRLRRSAGGTYHFFVADGQIVVAHVEGGSEVDRIQLALPAGTVVAGRPTGEPPRQSVGAPIPAPQGGTGTVHSTLPLVPPLLRAQPHSVAIVIGIQQYRAPLSPADNARSDAERMAEYFQAIGISRDRMVLLIDDHATVSDIRNHLDSWLTRVASEANRVYFYFSGHGLPDLSTNTPYIVPYDGDYRFLEKTAIPVAEIYQRLARSKIREAVVILDACFSGLTKTGTATVAGTHPLLPVTSLPEPKFTKQQIALTLTASSGRQLSGAHPSAKLSLFTFYLYEGLRYATADSNRDSQISAKELFDYVLPRVKNATLIEQVPSMKLTGGKSGSQFILQSSAAAAVH